MEFVIFGDAEKDLGHWFRYGSARDLAGRPVEVEFRIRRLPMNVAQAMEAAYGRKKQIQFGGGLVPARERTEGEVTDLMLDKAAFAWTGVRGLVVTIGDSEAANVFGALQDGEVAVGAKLLLPLDVPDVIKRYILARFLGLVQWIVERVDELEKAVGREEVAAAKNS